MTDTGRVKKARRGNMPIPATEAAKNFGRLVDRVRETRATYTIERGGKAVAQIGPVESRRGTLADFKAWVQAVPHVDEEYLRELEDIVHRHNRPRVPRNPWGR